MYTTTRVLQCIFHQIGFKGCREGLTLFLDDLNHELDLLFVSNPYILHEFLNQRCVLFCSVIHYFKGIYHGLC